MTKKIILCVDDTPDDYYAAPEEGLLRARLENVYKKYKDRYELKFASTWDEYNGFVANEQTALVLLDYELKFGPGKDINGPDIADDLYLRRPDIRIVCLTTKLDKNKWIMIKGKKKEESGKRREMGHKSKKVEYIAKQELTKKADYLGNISQAIIEDYFNLTWGVLWEPEQGVVTLSRGKTEQHLVQIGQSFSQVLTWCLRVPSKWAGPFWSETIVGKATDGINSAIREYTNGTVWGILTTEDSPTRCIKALVNPKNVKIIYCPAPVKCKKGGAPCDCIDKFTGFEIQVKEMIDKVEELKKQFKIYGEKILNEVDDMREQITAGLDDKHGKKWDSVLNKAKKLKK